MTEETPARRSDGLDALVPASGPWSVADAPSDARFLEFGPLRLPYAPALNVRLELQPGTNHIGAVSVLVADCEVQLQVVTAPRGAGVWGDIRRTISDKVRAKGGTTQVIEGHFGPELMTTVTARGRDGAVGSVTQRYVGIDGDRWMLRAVVTGPSVLTDATVERVNLLLSNCAVERGERAMGSGTVMRLYVPADSGPADIDPVAIDPAAIERGPDADEAPKA